MHESQTAEFPVFEVFVQKESLGFHMNVGSLRAASPELALQLAREIFFRREAAYNVWVVPQECIFSSPHDEAHLPVEGMDKRYRLPGGYDNATHWKRFKAKAMTIEEVAKDIRS